MAFRICKAFPFLLPLLLSGCPDSSSDLNPDIVMGLDGQVKIDLSPAFKKDVVRRLEGKSFYVDSISIDEVIDFNSAKFSPIWEVKFPFETKSSIPTSFDVGERFSGELSNVYSGPILLRKVYVLSSYLSVKNEFGSGVILRVNDYFCFKGAGQAAVPVRSTDRGC
ncbi:hypothetical protein PWG14_10975 (plasmid) [Chromobacterium amazonense]|uniref:hypothetical protein n=1 Tax=Chromobacterium amazonense TaxID=1382803 RepID=UPI00237E139D|nr:hypothetical protein [Chromobacterium amazonense]MDE1713134.1 hypothetical protein [Chromobacterium amazonense]